jgi:hypothetical protein
MAQKAITPIRRPKKCFLTRLLQLPRHVTRNLPLEHSGVFFVWVSFGLAVSESGVRDCLFFLLGSDVEVKFVILSLHRCMVRRVYKYV